MGHDHHEVKPNPEYDGPGQHCLPPKVTDTVPQAIFFAIVMILVVWGGLKLGGVV
jgi:hypothetical protein